MTISEAEKLIAALRKLVMAQDSLLWFYQEDGGSKAPYRVGRVKQAWREFWMVDAEIR